MAKSEAAVLCPHVMIFPLPLQGPVKCMLKLAEMLSLAGIRVTFLNSHHVQRRIPDSAAYLTTKYRNFRFQTLPDGLPDDNPRTGDQILNLLQSMEDVSQPLFRQILHSAATPVTCLIADGVFTFAARVAKDAGLPLLYFDTISPCGLWGLLSLPTLIQAGEVPFADEELDEVVGGMEGGVMRRRDLPSFCRIKDMKDPIIELVIKEAKHIPLAQGLIFNTFQHLDAPILSQMLSICPNIYAVGPLHAHLKTRLAADAASNSIWEEDKSCISWLHSQPPKSVIYVSIGSLAVMTRVQLYEIWHGLVNSGARFLWARRPGSVSGSEPDDEVPLDLLEGTKERGYVVSWVPQEEVLAHPSVGGFLTHSGWNSTLESIVAGKPMICWPFHADQQVNGRYVGEVWKLGLDMKDSCDRVVVEKMIRELMEVRKDFFLERAHAMAKLAHSSVGPGGSSSLDFDRLIQDIKMMNIPMNKIL
ncbi:7-deoxyloganetic acid glucosyltransferase-like [Salvia miltiorrhiza]|uniref:7-deoxyloganetic acid glucosyltransferase-like n=1 Tax=Salvia miltiorrhiza TaxID=226208 RepID=UPI0025ABA0D0|nr:7-deoxyloganetic acid glucosyltransferase-like [Salvia miltiorrhiza]